MYTKVQVGHPAPAFKAKAVVDGRFKSSGNPIDYFFTDNEHCLKAWNDTEEMGGGLGGVHIPLISDINHKMSRDYGVLIEEEGVAQRALFIIDPKGNIRNITVNDADVGRSVDEAQRILDALIFKDEFGEGCPIDWKKGDKGIDVKTKTSVDGNVEIPKRQTWTSWARPKLQRAWSGTSAVSLHSSTGATGGNSNVNTNPNPNRISLTAPTSAGSGYAERNRSHSNLGSYSSTLASSNTSVNDESLVSPGMNAKQFESQLDEALNAQKNTQAMLDNMQAQMQHTNFGVGVAS